MRFGNRKTSSNVESQSGGGGGFGGLGGGGMGGGGGMLLGLVFSKFGIGGVVVLFLIMFLVGGNPLGLSGDGGQQAVGPQAQNGAAPAEVCSAEPERRFLCQVLGSTEEHWTRLFSQAGASYRPPVMVFYPGRGTSGCGAAQAAMGPFYCPSDQRIYLDTSFFDELSRRLGAPGDFAQAYVVAHEVGHHIQTITGTAGSIRQAQAGTSKREGNALQVRMELQADCYAGVWAAQERTAALEPGDLEEGMRAAAAIGDDTLQKAGQGYVSPESFTHGTSAQRQEALITGFRGGSPAACEAYTRGI